MMVALMHTLQAELSVDGAATTLLASGWYGLHILGNGFGGVIIFFVLSGFVLSHQLNRLPGDWIKRCRTFIVGRLFRIYPCVWATLSIFVAIYFATGMGIHPYAHLYEMGHLIKEALLFSTNINGVMWTLQAELLAAPIILISFFAAQRFGVAALFACFLLFAGLSFTGKWNRLLLSDFPLVLQLMYSFVAGMLAWKTYRHCRGFSIWWLALAVIGFLSARRLIGWWNNRAMLTEAICASIAIALLVANPLIGKRIGLAGRVARYYGQISYSFYLLHPLTLIVLWSIPKQLTSAVEWGLPPTLLGIVLFVASVAVVTPIAHMQWALIERGGIAIGRRITATA